MNKIATFRSPFTTKFGIPRQAGVVEGVPGYIVFEPPYRSADAIRGLEDYDYLWLLWQFSANSHAANSLSVRPPRLGGNTRMGVFATRSPYRPNPIGLSSVRLHHIELDHTDGPHIHVLGADLMDGTPILDIKPYLPYADSHPDARAGFTDAASWQPLRVDFPPRLRSALALEPSLYDALLATLAQDPRPQYHNDPDRIYGMPFAGYDIRFRVSGSLLTVVEVVRL